MNADLWGNDEIRMTKETLSPNDDQFILGVQPSSFFGRSSVVIHH